MEIKYNPTLLNEQSVKAICLRIEFRQAFEGDADILFAERLDADLKHFSLYVQWAIGKNFMTGYLHEFGDKVPFKDALQLIEQFCNSHHEIIAEITFDQTRSLLANLTFWTYIQQEIRDLEPKFRSLFPGVEFKYGREKGWEWTTGINEDDSMMVSIVRKYLRRKGNYASELIINIGTDRDTAADIDDFGQQLRAALGTKILQGQQKYLWNGERELTPLGEYDVLA